MSLSLKHSQVLMALPDCGYAFALYRLPHASVELIVQQSVQVEVISNLASLNSHSGFLVAPFAISAQHPALLIAPQYRACGEEQIAALIDQLIAKDVTVRLAAEHIDTALAAATATASASNTATSATATTTTTCPVLEQTEALYSDYEKAFAVFMEALERGDFEKLVLSRAQRFALPPAFSAVAAFERACALYPQMMVTLVSTTYSGMWLGSSPEILLKGGSATHQYETVALAGTMPLADPAAVPDLSAWSQKNVEEQAFVSAYLRDVIASFGTNLQEHGPFSSAAGQVVHLKSEFSFALADSSKLGSLIAALHPTPAVCGLPKAAAYELIKSSEGYDRSYYSGILGPLSLDTTTALYVNLRCMSLERSALAVDFHPRCATLYAGGGILRSSQVQDEFQETQHKMKTMLSLLTPAL